MSQSFEELCTETDYLPRPVNYKVEFSDPLYIAVMEKYTNSIPDRCLGCPRIGRFLLEISDLVNTKKNKSNVGSRENYSRFIAEMYTRIHSPDLSPEDLEIQIQNRYQEILSRHTQKSSQDLDGIGSRVLDIEASIEGRMESCKGIVSEIFYDYKIKAERDYYACGSDTDPLFY